MKMLSSWTPDWSWSPRLSPNFMGEVIDEFDNIVNSFLQPTYANTVNFQPSCDINESKDHYLVTFDMPGVKKDNIKIEVRGTELVISGERQREAKNNYESTLRHERTYGKFERAFVLPSSINADKIEANYENGVLNIALPKTEKAKARKIPIQSGQNNFNKLLDSKKEEIKELKDMKMS